MSSLAEIEEAIASLPPMEQQALFRHLSAKLRNGVQDPRKIPPPDVPKAELERIHALIEAEFSEAPSEDV